ncbi:MarR family winged helix-turn-helix transcriptional regulator [Deinococcus sp. SM5_A1]|uniref:MarR family winged helix-turn-helix transcriptional regulator n=1 Tax=Deinococcus sp. SM5_A1 TaxID=3379094 RepID=UPI00385FE633
MSLPPSSPLTDAELNSPELHFLTALWDTWQALTTVGEARLRRHELDLRSFIALSYLQGGPQQPADLARELGVPRYEISRVLAALGALEAVTRERGGTDGRGVIVRITPAGRERWAAALQSVRALTGPPLAHLKSEQQFSLIQTLQGVAHAAQQQTESSSAPNPDRSCPHD